MEIDKEFRDKEVLDRGAYAPVKKKIKHCNNLIKDKKFLST